MSAHEVVVVRNRWWVRLLVGPLLAVIAVIAWWAVVAVLVDIAEVGPAAVVIVPLLLVLAATATYGAPGAVLIRESFGTDEIAVRVWVRTRRIPITTASRLELTRARLHTGRRQIPVGRLVLRGDPTLRFGGPRAILDPTLTHYDEALAVLRDWARRRPEIVADDRVLREILATASGG